MQRKLTPDEERALELFLQIYRQVDRSRLIKLLEISYLTGRVDGVRDASDIADRLFQ